MPIISETVSARLSPVAVSKAATSPCKVVILLSAVLTSVCNVPTSVSKVEISVFKLVKLSSTSVLVRGIHFTDLNVNVAAISIFLN